MAYRNGYIDYVIIRVLNVCVTAYIQYSSIVRAFKILFRLCQNMQRKTSNYSRSDCALEQQSFVLREHFLRGQTSFAKILQTRGKSYDVLIPTTVIHSMRFYRNSNPCMRSNGICLATPSLLRDVPQFIHLATQDGISSF